MPNKTRLMRARSTNPKGPHVRQTRSSLWVLTGIWLALLSAATTAVAAALLFYVPGQKRIFDEFGLRLPTLSKWVIRASSFVAAYWWVLVPAVLAALCGTLLLCGMLAANGPSAT